MIFVAVGTQKFQLNRLLKEIDTLIDNDQLTEEVFAQIGHSDYHPKYYQYENFLSKDKFEEYIKHCDILITHSGVGTIISGITCRKPVIVFPRRAMFQEHVDDHQLQIAKSFSEQGFVLLCQEEKKLAQTIEDAKKFVFQEYHSQRKRVIREIQDFLQNN